jgi:hypothetical protein
LTRYRLLAAAAAATAVVAAVPASAHIPAIGTTTLDGVTATASGSAVSVAGRVTFGGQSPVVLGTDPAGDNLGAAATQPLGTDLTGLALAHREPDVPELTFELRLADLRSPRGMFEAAQYNWDIEVDGGAAKPGGSNWSIKSMGSRATTQSTAAYAGVFECVPGSTGTTCTEKAKAEAVYDTASKTVYVNVPLTAIGARPGSRIAAWNRGTNPVWVGPSAGGAQTLANLFDTVPAHATYTVPSAGTVEVTAVGPDGTTARTTSSTTDSTGAFTAGLTVDGPGTYDVTVRACFATNCATKTLPVEVTS